VLTAVASLTSLAPYVGGFVSASLTGYVAHGSRRRFEALIWELEAEIAKLGVEKVDADFFETDEFTDLLLKAGRISGETRDAEKRRWCAAILAGALAVDHAPDLDHEGLLGTVGALSPQTLAVARECFVRATNSAPTNLENPLVEPPDGVHGKFFLAQMRGAGLIDEESVSVYDTPSRVSYRVSPTFRALMELVGVEVERG
jgi:hypothetical protein